MRLHRFLAVLLALVLAAAACSSAELNTETTGTADDAAADDADNPVEGDDTTGEDSEESSGSKSDIDADDAQVKEQVAQVEAALDLEMTEAEEACFTAGIFEDADLVSAMFDGADFEELDQMQIRGVMGLLFDCVNEQTLGAAIASGFADTGAELTPELSCAGEQLAALGPDAMADLAILGVSDSIGEISVSSLGDAMEAMVACDVDLGSLADDLGGALPGATPEQTNCFVVELFRDEALVGTFLTDPDSDDAALGAIDVMFRCDLGPVLADQVSSAAGLDPECFGAYVEERGADLFRELAESDATGADPSPETMSVFLTCGAGGGGLGDSAGGSYGDDPLLDGYQDACTAGDAEACDNLYLESPIGSEYEFFGATCGLRFDEPIAGFCVDEQLGG